MLLKRYMPFLIIKRYFFCLKKKLFVWSPVDAGTCAPISSLFLAIHVIGIGLCFITIYILSNLSFILFFVMHASFLPFFHASPLFFLLIYRRIAQHLNFIRSHLHFLVYFFYSRYHIFIGSFFYSLSCMSLFIECL